MQTSEMNSAKSVRDSNLMPVVSFIHTYLNSYANLFAKSRAQTSQC